MYLARTTWLRAAVAVTLAACADTPTDALEDREVSDALALMLPILSPALFVVSDTSDVGGADGVGGPSAAVIAPREEPEIDHTPPPPDALAGIREARTHADFQPGYGRATGQHFFQANKSRIDTTVNVASDGTPLGSQSAYRENDGWFWYYFGQWRHIFASARFYTDRSCGLTAWGGSIHKAWQEVVVPPGGSVSRFGEVGETTTSDLARQPACPPNHYAFAGGGSGTMLCYFWIEYDEYTGQVYSVDLLFCEELGG